MRAPRLLIGLAALALLAPMPAAAQSRFLTRSAFGAGAAADAAPATAIPLPALPLATGAKVVAFCDSHSAFNNPGNGGVAAAPAGAKGLIEAAWSADPRFNFDSWYDAGDPWRRTTNGGANTSINGANQGIPSDHLVNAATSAVVGGGAMQRLRYALSRAPDLIVLNCGTNSINSGDVTGTNAPASAAYVIAQLDRMLARITRQGVWTILSTIYPNASWPIGDPRHQIERDVNIWIRAQAGRAGVAAIIDPYAALVSPTDPDGVIPAYFIEGASGVHLSASGIQLVSAGYLLPALRNAIASGTMFDQTAANANLWPAGTYGMAGTTGGKVGAQTSGSVATGYSLRMLRAGGGSTQVAAKDGTDATYNRQSITITPGGVAAWDQSVLTFPALAISTATVPAGSWLRAYVRIETADALSAANIMLTVSALNASAATRVSALAGVIDSNQFQVVGAGRGIYWLATKPFQMPADGDYASIATTLTINFGAAAYPAGSGFTVKADRPILRLSGDPRPAWRLP